MHQLAYSPTQFCDQHGIARTTFYALLKNGRGPRTFKVGRRTLISVEAATDWRARMEVECAGTPGQACNSMA
jgi:hypothetical protein